MPNRLIVAGRSVPKGPPVWFPTSVNAISGGTATAPVPGPPCRTHYVGCWIGAPCTLTGLKYVTNTNAGNVILTLHDPLGNLAIATDDNGTAMAGTSNTFQAIPFEGGPYEIITPGVWLFGIRGDNASGRFMTYGQTGAIVPTGASDLGNFAQVPLTLPIPTGYTTGQGPIIHSY